MNKATEKEIYEKSPWYIFIPGGKYAYAIGKTGQYESELSKALPFYNHIDAVIYSEKHGLGKIATIRKVTKQKN